MGNISIAMGQWGDFLFALCWQAVKDIKLQQVQTDRESYWEACVRLANLLVWLLCGGKYHVQGLQSQR